MLEHLPEPVRQKQALTPAAPGAAVQPQVRHEVGAGQRRVRLHCGLNRRAALQVLRQKAEHPNDI